MSKEKPKSSEAESGKKQKKEYKLIPFQAKSEKEIGPMSEEVKDKWESMKQEKWLLNYLGPAIGLGVPREELDRHAREAIQKLENQQSYFEALDAYKLLKKFSIRNYTDSDIDKIARDLCEKALADPNYNSEAVGIARSMWGEESEEYQKAEKVTIERIKQVSERIDVMARRAREIDLENSQLHTKRFLFHQKLTVDEEKKSKELKSERERLIKILNESGIPSVEKYLSDKDWAKSVEERQKKDRKNREKFSRGDMAEDEFRTILLHKTIFGRPLTEFEKAVKKEPEGFYKKFKKWLLENKRIADSSSLDESEELKLLEEWKKSKQEKQLDN